MNPSQILEQETGDPLLRANSPADALCLESWNSDPSSKAALSLRGVEISAATLQQFDRIAHPANQQDRPETQQRLQNCGDEEPQIPRSTLSVEISSPNDHSQPAGPMAASQGLDGEDSRLTTSNKRQGNNCAIVTQC